MKVEIKITREMRVHLQHAESIELDITRFVDAQQIASLQKIEEGYRDGFMAGYNQEENLINPEQEAAELAADYALLSK